MLTLHVLNNLKWRSLSAFDKAGFSVITTADGAKGSHGSASILHIFLAVYAAQMITIAMVAVLDTYLAGKA